MRALIDECGPRALKHFLIEHGHARLSLQEAGWAGKENGELLALAENKFDVRVTIDTNLRYQQNLTGRRIAIVIIMAKSKSFGAPCPAFSFLCKGPRSNQSRGCRLRGR